MCRSILVEGIELAYDQYWDEIKLKTNEKCSGIAF